MQAPTPTRFGTGPRQLGLSAAVALFTLAVLPTGAETMTFTATGDNTILSGALANDNYGNFNPISSGTVGFLTQRSILRFDVSALEGLYSGIDSLTLRLFYYDDTKVVNFARVDVTTDVHTITAANLAWIEGTSVGAAQTGESTWNNLARNSTPWAGSGGLDTAGTDYASTVLASHTLAVANRPAADSAIDFNFAGSSAQLTALIDAWMVDNVDNARANPGLLLRDPSPTFAANIRNRLAVHSTEDANAALHPQLIVEYSTAASDFRVIVTPAAGTPGHYDFEWNSQPGKVYDLVSSTDLATAPASWEVYDPDGPGGNDPYGDIPSAGDTTTLTAVPSADPRRFFAMRERDAPPPPPVFSADFETDGGGFTLVGTPNDWAWGTPNSNNNDGLLLTTGNAGSAGAWATNLGTGATPSGLIDPVADSILRSPDIDLTGITGAKLSFAAAHDAQSGDIIEVRVREVASNALLDTFRPVDTTSATASNWTTLGPFDLSAADNTSIYFEFRYDGTDGNFIGLYLDDVVVSPN
jgi:hypothetical protein